jgi:FG-GAP repeat protein
MNDMRAKRRRLAATSLLGVLGLLAGCADNDHTDLCVGPGCADFQGFAGRNSLTASGLGDLDAGPDAGASCEVAIVSPAPADGGSPELGSADDIDGEACGASYTARVVVRSNAALVRLFVNDNPLGALEPTALLAAFDAELGNRGERTNVLRAEAVMASGQRCNTELRGVRVACAGPSCSIESPRASRDGYLGQSDDLDDDDAGLQANIEIGTESEHAGQAARLSIDGDFERVPEVIVQADGERGVATFEGVTLEEGPHAVRAECSDAEGHSTLSPAVDWNVDVEACTLAIDSIASGASPITPGDDLDENASNGLDVLVRGSILGESCQSIHIGPCGAAGADIALGGLVGEDGGFLVPIKLAAVTGQVELCGRVSDAAGNTSTPDSRATVNVRADAPSVALLSPSGTTRYNLAGTAGALADGNPGSQGSCEIDVSVGCSDVGVQVELLADGAELATTPCVAAGGGGFAGVATFTDVSVPSQNDGSSLALGARQSVRGLAPGESSEVLIQPDCSAPLCVFESPAPGTASLGAALDASGDPGYQLDVSVATALEAAGPSVLLTVDGDTDGALTSLATAGGSGAQALFAAVPLSEAQHDVVAVCADAAGNQSAAEATWTVDITPCTGSLVIADGHDPIIPSDDLDPQQAGLQVGVDGDTSGCVAARVGVCGALTGDFSDLGPGGSFALTASVAAASGDVELCAELQDAAGNVTTEAVTVGVRVNAPSVSFVEPSSNQQFTDVTGCVVDARVECSDEGAPVEVFEDGVSRGSVNCNGGEATVSFTLQTKNGGEPTVLTARQIAEGVPSALASVSVQADCDLPVLAITSPTCNGQLALAGDDVDLASPGLQFDVSVANGGVPTVTLTVTRTTSSELEATGSATQTDFAAVNLGGAGQITLGACATDPQGNTACAPSCPITIAAEPSIAITNPRPPATFTIEDDCDTGETGLSIQVQGTTNAAAGSPVELSIGTGTPTTALVASGAYSACVQAPDGEDQTLSATVTDSATGLDATARVIVSVNTSAPPEIAAPSFAVTGRREGTIELTWQSVLDASGDPLVAYHVRCAASEITTELEWSEATDFPVSLTPASAAGITETQTLTGFLTGFERFCLVRGEDAYGQLGALSGNVATLAEVSNPFLEVEYSPVLASADAARANIAAIGDVNGDGQNDFAYSTPNRGVQVFFGGGPAPDSTPDITITSPDQSGAFNHELGWSLSGLGDINGDGRPDFAVGARYMTHPASIDNGGSLFVFFGRDAGSAWPATIQVQPSPGCGADICFHGSERVAYLGSSVTGTNFDGAGAADLVIGARNRTLSATQRVGRVYVVLGGAQLNVPAGTVFDLPGANLEGFTIDPPTTSTRSFGFDVAGVGAGNDGRGDLVISALGRTQEGINAEVFHVTGRAYTGAGGLTAATAPSPFAVGAPGSFSTLRAAGDVNGDSFADVWVSTNLALGGVSPVYLGRSSGFSGVRLLGFTNDVVTDFWGTYVGAGSHAELGNLSDLDQNGFSELFVGSLAFDGSTPGSAELFYSEASSGSRQRSEADVHFTASNGQLTPGFVGDITGDGYADVVLLDSGGANPSRMKLLY